MRTAGASFNLTVKEERTGVAGKTASFNSACRTEKETPQTLWAGGYQNTPWRAACKENTKGTCNDVKSSV